jgi:hypothetical protein
VILCTDSLAVWVRAWDRLSQKFANSHFFVFVIKYFVRSGSDFCAGCFFDTKHKAGDKPYNDPQHKNQNPAGFRPSVLDLPVSTPRGFGKKIFIKN